MPQRPASLPAAPFNSFATTRWSLVLAASSQSDTVPANEALGSLCRIYWQPIFAFICRRGYSPEEAQDLTQDFFVMILETDWLQRADERRGRFRSFLLKSLQNFLGHANERKAAAKRGAKFNFVSWDTSNRKRRFRWQVCVNRSAHCRKNACSICDGPRRSLNAR